MTEFRNHDPRYRPRPTHRQSLSPGSAAHSVAPSGPFQAAPVLQRGVFLGGRRCQRQARIGSGIGNAGAVMAQGAQGADVLDRLWHAGHGGGQIALEILSLGLVAGAEIEGHDDAQQPPQRFGHQRQALHPFPKPDRIGHRRDKEAQRPQRQCRARQPVQPVHEPVEPATPALREFRRELVQRAHLYLGRARRPGLGILAEHLDRFAHRVAATAKQHSQQIADQSHPETLR
ncbi:hypothetical protein SPO1879 [Ruegeria pomeroyi DSS-3]|uniref:Uncharacterized protein n=1 Tax=Ruegeria pomeroyi (strain ATCC 700808 / DSM 15171 / DSS-3) TaxID=246200 RepID=Q5LS89_RUEPO|nr:hypothetical protein SPO1879 [Ruegeria pomeroyi DSS-3]